MNKFPNDATGATLDLFQQEGLDLSKPLERDFCLAVPSEPALFKEFVDQAGVIAQHFENRRFSQVVRNIIAPTKMPEIVGNGRE